MRRRLWMVLLCSAATGAAFSTQVRAVEPALDGPPVVAESGTAYASAPVMDDIHWMSSPPTLTNQQIKMLEDAAEHTHLSPPDLGPQAQTPLSNERLDPATATEPPAANAPSPNGAPIYQWLEQNNFSGKSSGYGSNVMESSISNLGKYYFYTGNWFAARSSDGGSTWTYADPFSGFANFCCDQVTIADESRDIILWLRMGLINNTTPNPFKLTVFKNGFGSSCTYDFTPTGINSTWTGEAFDYPHISVAKDYVYITWNLFDSSSWTRSIIQRLPLSSLQSCASLSYNYYQDTAWSSWVPAHGDQEGVHFASNWPSTSPQNSRLKILLWYECCTSTSTYEKSVTAWSFTNKDATCGTPNWLGRSDQRLKAGAWWKPNGWANGVVTWWWNVKAGGSFPYPYVEAASFFANSLDPVTDLQPGRPYIYSPSSCWAYPSAAPNRRHDLALVATTADPAAPKPSLFALIADDNASLPPGFSDIQLLQASSAAPSDAKWGDYNTIREFKPSGQAWIYGGHYISSGTNCATCGVETMGVFGRNRDVESWNRWKNL